MKRFAAWVTLPVALLITAWLSMPPQDVPRGPYLKPLLPRLELLRVLGAGQIPMVTDYFWIQAIQAMGRAGESMAQERYLDVYYYSDLVTDLDPRFYKVYAFAGNAVPTNLGRETYVNVDEGIAILEKGVKQFPDDWRLNFYYAANISYLRKEHAKAAGIMTRVARMKDAPPYVAEIASRLLIAKGDFDTAYALVDAAAAAEDDKQIKEVLERRKLELIQEQMLERVDAAITQFQQREGRLPRDVRELVTSRDLDRMPHDPLMGEIKIGPDGRSYSTAMELRLAPMDYERRRHQKYDDPPKEDHPE